MERSLLKELNNKNLTAYLNRQKEAILKNLFWNQFFPLKATSTLTWESISGSSGHMVMADVIEYNASAPLKSRRIVSSAKGDIPAIALKRKMDAKDMNDYEYFKRMASGDADKMAILDIVFNDIDFVFNGVMARTEYLALQALSYGALNLTLDNNNGIITETAVDFGIPTANKTAVSVVWSNAATATPISDIRAKYRAIRANGHICTRIIMNDVQWAQFVACAEVKDAYAYYQGVSSGRIAVPGLEGVNAMLTAERLPVIQIVDSIVRHETEAHVITSLNTWKDGYVTFVPDVNIGNVLHGPIAEEASAELKKIATTSKVSHVFISKWASLDPYGEYTKGQANAFPAFNDAEQVYILKVDGTSWS